MKYDGSSAYSNQTKPNQSLTHYIISNKQIYFYESCFCRRNSYEHHGIKFPSFCGCGWWWWKLRWEMRQLTALRKSRPPYMMNDHHIFPCRTLLGQRDVMTIPHDFGVKSVVGRWWERGFASPLASYYMVRHSSIRCDCWVVLCVPKTIQQTANVILVLCGWFVGGNLTLYVWAQHFEVTDCVFVCLCDRRQTMSANITWAVCVCVVSDDLSRYYSIKLCSLCMR